MDKKEEELKANKPDPVRKRNRTGCIIICIIILVPLIAYVVIAYNAERESQREANFKRAVEALSKLEELNSHDESSIADTSTFGDKKTAPSGSSTSSESVAGSSDQSLTPTEETPSYSFLDFYIDIANTSIRGNEGGPTIRWNKPKVYIGGEEAPDALDATYRSCLSFFVSDFNANSSNVKLENNVELANIRIYFMTEAELIAQYETKLPFAIPSSNSNGEMTGADIVMPSNTDWLEDEKCWSLKHEIMHAVGFLGHSNKIDNSEMSFNPLFITYGGLSSSDQRAIRMLYNSGIPLLSSQQEARDFFNSRSY